MRKMLGITIKEGLKRWLLTEEPGFKRKAYFQIKQGTIIDMFDSIRLAMLSTSDEHRAVIAGIPWFSVFQVTKPDGILKTPTFEKDYTWHAVKIAGWTTVYGVTYLKVKSWQGENFGDNGWCYMPRELCNVLFSYSGSAAFTVTKVKPDQIQTANLNVVDTIVSYVRYLWGKMNSV